MSSPEKIFKKLPIETPDYPQEFLMQLNQQLKKDEIQFLKQPFPQIQFQKSDFEYQRKLKFPSVSVIIYGVLQMCYCFAIIYLTFSIVTIYISLLLPFSILYAFYIIFFYMKYQYSKPRKLLSRRKTKENILQYYLNLKKNQPQIKYYAQAYNWDKTKTRKRTIKYKISQFDKYHELEYSSQLDNSENLTELLKNFSSVIIKTKFIWYSGNQLAQNNWDNIRLSYNLILQSHPTTLEAYDASSLSGIEDEQLVFLTGNIQFYINYIAMIVSYFLGLGLFYDIFFYSYFNQVTYYVQKVIFCSEDNNKQMSIILKSHLSNYQMILNQEPVKIKYNLLDPENNIYTIDMKMSDIENYDEKSKLTNQNTN